MRRALLILMLALVGGCATTPPFTTADKYCHFKQRQLIVDDPDRDPDDSKYDLDDLKPLNRVLVLSGGSQNGAYGAGFLKRWAAESPGGMLPQFDLVTGISTGAILSTWAFIGKPDQVAQQYGIKDEEELLNVYARPSRGGGMGMGGALKLVRKNSFADLDPLRQKLRGLFTHQLLGEVRDRPGRLKIAAVDVDDGQAIVFDMKEMATRAANSAPGSPEFEHLRNCYAEAVIASSSVPMAAKPGFIDNRMYIDGGARFGVFVDYLQRAFARKRALAQQGAVGEAAKPAVKPAAPKLYILVNGTQWADTPCGKMDEAKCDTSEPLDPDPYENRDGAHKKWQIATLAMRSTDIMIKQVYRFSVSRVKEQYDQLYPGDEYEQHFYFSRMHRHHLQFDKLMDDRTCLYWKGQDKKTKNPVEFYPTYMKCLQLYGARQAMIKGWWKDGASSPYGPTAD